MGMNSTGARVTFPALLIRPRMPRPRSSALTWRLEVGGWRLEVGGWRLEVGADRVPVCVRHSHRHLLSGVPDRRVVSDVQQERPYGSGATPASAAGLLPEGLPVRLPPHPRIDLPTLTSEGGGRGLGDLFHL